MRIVRLVENQKTETRSIKEVQSYLAALNANMKLAWRNCCAYDGYEGTEANVVFSKDNPFLPIYLEALKRLFKARGEYDKGGYQSVEFGGRIN